MPRHPLSIAGAWLVTISAFVFLLVFLLDVFGVHHNPYFGLVFFVLLPTLFVVGLLMIPFGIVLERRRRAKGLGPRTWPRIDLNEPSHRRAVAILLALTAANLLIVSLAAFRGVEYMDSPQFCGQVCHRPMEPEFVSHLDGPHARVACVNCHVGSGAPWFVKSKINGVHQVVAVIRGNYARPIESPVADLRSARETCEHCHSAGALHGDKVVVIPAFASDETNTPSPTRLIMHVGGGPSHLGLGRGIHWHADPQNEIEFVSTDAKRQVIPYVRLKDRNGQVREYRTADVTDAQIAAGSHRRMDCVDCHNRPTHDLSSTAERAVDDAIAGGAIPVALPYARKHALEVLNATYPDRATAAREIDQRLRAFYTAAADPPAADIDRLVKATQFLYTRNVFPAMRVTFGTHVNHIGHTDSPGCFRCHDDEHKAADGQKIGQDCESCHAIE